MLSPMWTSAIVAVLLIAPGVAFGSGGEPVPARASMTLDADASGSVRIALEAAASIDLSTGWSFTGSGVLYGFAIAAEPIGASSPAIWIARADEGGVQPMGACRNVFLLSACPAKLSLPAGVFRVYALVDDGPVSVSLTLDGVQEGDLALTPNRPSGFEVRLLEEYIPDPSGIAYASGNMDVMPGPGAMLMTMQTRALVNSPALFAMEYGFCLYSDTVEDESRAFLPGCPDLPPHAVSATVTMVASGAAGGPTIEIHRVNVGPGSTGHGFWFLSSYPLPGTDTLGAWVPLD